jgi:hypothetical protein
MKTQLLIGFFLSAASINLNAQSASNPKFDWGTARKLCTCPDRLSPVQGPISVAQATIDDARAHEDRLPYNAAVTFVDILKLEITPKTRDVNTADILRWPRID